MAATFVLVCWVPAVPALAQDSAVSVTFQTNDAFVKDKVLPGVEITAARTQAGAVERTGVTGPDGWVVLSLSPGKWFVSYRLKGYVPITRSETEIRAAGQVITTTLSMRLEEEGKLDHRRVRIILNWGSDPRQVKDADSHVICACASHVPHVYFRMMKHEGTGHAVSLDVDDRDWGGPETITLLDPPPGAYRYFVHDFSGPPARLGDSDVVVRVLDNDSMIGEFRAPADVDQRCWSPFKSLDVPPAGEVTLVRFNEDELLKGVDREIPAEMSASPETGDDSDPGTDESDAESDSEDVVRIVLTSLFFGVVLVGVVIARVRKRA